MKGFIQKYKLGIVGIFVGGILGYAYYHFVGCNSGELRDYLKTIELVGLRNVDGIFGAFDVR